MARFADACITQMSVQKELLADELGPETLLLDLRVGMHSGSVTAGVVRGRKARFQVSSEHRSCRF